MLSHCLLASIAFDENSAVNFIGVCLYVMSHFISLLSSFFVLVFQHFDIMCLGVDPFAIILKFIELPGCVDFFAANLENFRPFYL